MTMLLVFALLPLTGCPFHALIVVNVGIANKTAAAVSAPFDVNAYCAALTRQGYIVKQSNTVQETTIAPDQTEKVCREVWFQHIEDERKAKEKKK